MDVYKLRFGLHPVHKIEKNQFESDTLRAYPWYQDNAQGSPAQFAVCPACDNPIQIIALYRLRGRNSPVCHGRHVSRDVPGLVDYSQAAYDLCPYANPNLQLEPTMRRNGDDPMGRVLLQLLREQFDRVIYIISKVTGIRISESLAHDMLEIFLGMRGHLYVGANICNLPWIFAYLSNAQNLFGRVIKADSPLRCDLEKHKKICFNEKGQIQNAPGERVDLLRFCFMHHAVGHSAPSIKETIQFVVSEGETILYQETLIIDPMYFHNLVNLPPERARRQQQFLDIAAAQIRI